jgi:hypothetical protein
MVYVAPFQTAPAGGQAVLAESMVCSPIPGA